MREGRALAARIPSRLRILASLRQPPTSLNASCLVIFIHNLTDQFLIHNPAHSLNQYGLRSSHPSGRVAALQKLTTNELKSSAVFFCELFLNPTFRALRTTKREAVCVCHTAVWEVVWNHLDSKMKFQVLLSSRPRPSNFL